MASLRLLLCAALVPTVAALWPLPDRRSVMDGMNTYFQSTTTLANGVAEPMQEEGFYCYGGGAGASSTSAVERVAHSLLLPFTSVRFVVSGKGLMTKVYSRDTNDFGEWLVNAHDTLEAKKEWVSGRREQRGEATCTEATQGDGRCGADGGGRLQLQAETWVECAPVVPFWPFCTPRGLSLLEPCATNGTVCDNFVASPLRVACIGVGGAPHGATVTATESIAWLNLAILATGVLLILFADKIAESDLFYDTIGAGFGILFGLSLVFIGIKVCCFSERRDNVRNVFGFGAARVGFMWLAAKAYGAELRDWFHNLPFNSQAFVVTIIVGYFLLIIIIGREAMRQIMTKQEQAFANEPSDAAHARHGEGRAAAKYNKLGALIYKLVYFTCWFGGLFTVWQFGFPSRIVGSLSTISIMAVVVVSYVVRLVFAHGGSRARRSRSRRPPSASLAPQVPAVLNMIKAVSDAAFKCVMAVTWPLRACARCLCSVGGRCCSGRTREEDARFQQHPMTRYVSSFKSARAMAEQSKILSHVRVKQLIEGAQRASGSGSTSTFIVPAFGNSPARHVRHSSAARGMMANLRKKNLNPASSHDRSDFLDGKVDLSERSGCAIM
jgi:hypothetical protein